MRRIKVEAGALLMLAAVLISERADIFLGYALCALLHEIGHLAAARSRNIAVREIRIDMSGARICTEEGAGSYADEFILCLAGPLVNVLIVSAVVFAFNIMGISPACAVAEMSGYIFEGKMTAVGFVAFFALCAVLQGTVNLLPIKTLDGGRMLYCLLALTVSQKVAERVIGILSALCAFAIWTVALYLMIRISAGLGMYVFCACLFLGTLRDSELVQI